MNLKKDLVYKMNMNKVILEALKPIGIPVSFQIYSGEKESYITFFIYNEKGEMFAEDEEAITGVYIQVDVWTKGDYTDIVKRVKELLKLEGFQRSSEIDLYEDDTGIYHKGIRFFYAQNN